MRTTIEVVRHEDQRYSTAGDWQFPDHNLLRVRVSELGDWRYEAAIAVHEFVEAILCKNDGIAEAEVDAFDKDYAGEFTEPGDDPRAPYHRQHRVALEVERSLIAALGVTWDEYCTVVEALP